MQDSLDLVMAIQNYVLPRVSAPLHWFEVRVAVVVGIPRRSEA